MRNIVLVTLDSLRADHCSFMGYKRKTTPTLDRMARNGLYFENAIAPGVGTPISMTGIFTGMHLLDYSWKIEAIRRETIMLFKKQKTLAQVLSRIGYSTGAFTPNAFASGYFGFNKGFDFFQDFLSEEVNKGFAGQIYKKIFQKFTENQKWASNLRNIRNLIQKEEIFKPWEDYYTLIYNWIKKTDKPFFLWILLLDTHYPYLVPRKYRKWGNLFDMYFYNWKVQSAGWYPKFSEREREKYINAYDDSIRYADAFIKRLWKDIESEEPIFIIHADHGDGFGEHNFYGHNFPLLYEELIHVPLIIYNADTKGKVEAPVSLLGISPTILELIGKENDFPSKSFLYGSEDWVISEVFEKGKRRLAVRMKDWSLITGQKDENELYHLKNDPREQENLIDNHPKLAEEMKKIMKLHIKKESERVRIYERRKL